MSLTLNCYLMVQAFRTIKITHSWHFLALFEAFSIVVLKEPYHAIQFNGIIYILSEMINGKRPPSLPFNGVAPLYRRCCVVELAVVEISRVTDASVDRHFSLGSDSTK